VNLTVAVYVPAAGTEANDRVIVVDPAPVIVPDAELKANLPDVSDRIAAVHVNREPATLFVNVMSCHTPCIPAVVVYNDTGVLADISGFPVLMIVTGTVTCMGVPLLSDICMRGEPGCHSISLMVMLTTEVPSGMLLGSAVTEHSWIISDMVPPNHAGWNS